MGARSNLSPICSTPGLNTQFFTAGAVHPSTRPRLTTSPRHTRRSCTDSHLTTNAQIAALRGVVCIPERTAPEMARMREEEFYGLGPQVQAATASQLNKNSRDLRHKTYGEIVFGDLSRDVRAIIPCCVWHPHVTEALAPGPRHATPCACAGADGALTIAHGLGGRLLCIGHPIPWLVAVSIRWPSSIAHVRKAYN